jgi:hypothetical protein
MWAPCNLQTSGELKYARGLTTVVWVLVGIGLFSCAVSQLHPPYVRTLAWGVALVIAGSAIPQMLHRCRGHAGRKWARAVCVGIVIAGGALSTTYGWNERSKYFGNRAILEAAASEWKLNDLRNVAIEFNLKYIQEYGYEKQLLFDLPTHWHIVRAIDMAKLRRSSPEYSPSVLALLQYVRDIDFLCLRLEKVNSLFGVPLADKGYRKMIDQTFGRGDAYPEYVKTHRLLEKTFRRDYPGLLEQVDHLQCKPYVRPDAPDRKRPFNSQAPGRAAQDPKE